MFQTYDNNLLYTHLHIFTTSCLRVVSSLCGKPVQHCKKPRQNMRNVSFFAFPGGPGLDEDVSAAQTPALEGS